jgi:hypothetical protein
MREGIERRERRAPELDRVSEGVIDAEGTRLGMSEGGEGEHQNEDSDDKISAA